MAESCRGLGNDVHRVHRSEPEIEADREECSWGHMLWLANRTIGNAHDVVLGCMVMRPGASHDGTRRPKGEQILYLIQGVVEHRIGNKTVMQNPGDCVSVPPETSHEARNVGREPAHILVAFPSGEEPHG